MAQTYKALVPNGARIPNPCDRSKTWDAIGHTNPAGGGARTSFGKGFDTAGKSWTKQFCMQDSDGDGKTNGAELGDPNCVWIAGGTPAVVDLGQLTHPGVCEPLNATICAGKNPFLTCANNFTQPPIKGPNSATSYTVAAQSISLSMIIFKLFPVLLNFVLV